MLRLVMLSDVGGHEYHTGDDAMLDAAVFELRRRGEVDIVLMATGSAATPGAVGLRRLLPIGFPDGLSASADIERDRRLEDVVLGVASDEASTAVRRAIESADAVVVAGGGNLVSSWPHFLYERCAALTLAQKAGLPTVLVGQTIGPWLTERQRSQLAPVLAAAHVVGLRDEASMTLVRDLVPEAASRLQVDDAAFLPGEAPDVVLPASFVSLALHHWADHGPDDGHALAALIRGMHATAGLPVVLLPNTGQLDGRHAPLADASFALELETRIGDRTIALAAPLLPARQFAHVARSSVVMVSTRFHPLVFALSGTVPSIGISTDRYTRLKLEGALGHAGLQSWCLPSSALLTEAPRQLFEDLWSQREVIAEHLLGRKTEWERAHTQRWDDVWTILSDRSGRRREPRPPDEEVVLQRRPATELSSWLRSIEIRAEEQRETALRRSERAEEYAAGLQEILEHRDNEIGNLRGSCQQHAAELLAAQGARAEQEADQQRMEVEIAHARAAAQAARGLAGAVLEDQASQISALQANLHVTHQRSLEELEQRLQVEIDRLHDAIAEVHATRTMRWLKRPRSAYRKLRMIARILGSSSSV